MMSPYCYNHYIKALVLYCFINECIYWFACLGSFQFTILSFVFLFFCRKIKLLDKLIIHVPRQHVSMNLFFCSLQCLFLWTWRARSSVSIFCYHNTCLEVDSSLKWPLSDQKSCTANLFIWPGRLGLISHRRCLSTFDLSDIKSCRPVSMRSPFFFRKLKCVTLEVFPHIITFVCY